MTPCSGRWPQMKQSQSRRRQSYPDSWPSRRRQTIPARHPNWTAESIHHPAYPSGKWSTPPWRRQPTSDFYTYQSAAMNNGSRLRYTGPGPSVHPGQHHGQLYANKSTSRPGTLPWSDAPAKRLQSLWQQRARIWNQESLARWRCKKGNWRPLCKRH